VYITLQSQETEKGPAIIKTFVTSDGSPPSTEDTFLIHSIDPVGDRLEIQAAEDSGPYLSLTGALLLSEETKRGLWNDAFIAYDSGGEVVRQGHYQYEISCQ
jgi:hypothetical protein